MVSFELPLYTINILVYTITLGFCHYWFSILFLFARLLSLLLMYSVVAPHEDGKKLVCITRLQLMHKKLKQSSLFHCMVN